MGFEDEEECGGSPINISTRERFKATDNDETQAFGGISMLVDGKQGQLCKKNKFQEEGEGIQVEGGLTSRSKKGGDGFIPLEDVQDEKKKLPENIVSS
jgi:hypothetical protein